MRRVFGSHEGLKVANPPERPSALRDEETKFLTPELLTRGPEIGRKRELEPTRGMGKPRQTGPVLERRLKAERTKALEEEIRLHDAAGADGKTRVEEKPGVKRRGQKVRVGGRDRLGRVAGLDPVRLEPRGVHRGHNEIAFDHEIAEPLRREPARATVERERKEKMRRGAERKPRQKSGETRGHGFGLPARRRSGTHGGRTRPDDEAGPIRRSIRTLRRPAVLR